MCACVYGGLQRWHTPNTSLMLHCGRTKNNGPHRHALHSAHSLPEAHTNPPTPRHMRLNVSFVARKSINSKRDPPPTLSRPILVFLRICRCTPMAAAENQSAMDRFYCQNRGAEQREVSTGLSKFYVTQNRQVKPVTATPVPESSFTFWFSRLRQTL